MSKKQPRKTKVKQKPICAPCHQGRHSSKGAPEHGSSDVCPDKRCGCPCRLAKAKVPKTKEVTFKIDMNYVVMVPPPTGLKLCPRCGKEHKKLKALKLTKPMDFFGKGADGKPVPTARASYWMLCPKLKEPIILYDRYVTAENVENYLVNSMVKEIAEHEDQKFLAEMRTFAKQTKKNKGKPMQQEIRVKYSLGDVKTWVFDPNVPTRMVPAEKPKGGKTDASGRRGKAVPSDAGGVPRPVSGHRRPKVRSGEVPR